MTESATDRALRLLITAAREAQAALPLDPLALALQVGLTLDGWQEQVLRSSARQILLCCCRQSGKSTVAALRALHRALTVPTTLVLAISPAQRQSAELIRKCREFLARLDVGGLAQESVLSLGLTNGSRILALPGADATLRGYSADLVLVDEAARVSDSTVDAIRPMVSVTGGAVVLLSTPWGQRGRFWEAWTEGGSDWERIRVTADQCPRISPEWLEQERRQLPPLVYRSEYLCEFSDTLTQVFPTEQVLAALSDDVPLLFPRSAA